MSKVPLKNVKGDSVGDYEFADNLLISDKGDHAVYEAVVAYNAAQRAGTASTLSKSEVNGSGKKPWKQKGLGRARAGYKQSNVWRGGYVAHGPKPRDFSYHMPAKARRVALRSALAGKLADEEVVIADLGEFAAPSSKSARKILADLGAPRRACLVIAERSENLYKSFRNFPRVEVRTAAELCAFDVVNGGLIIAEREAMDQLASRVGIAGGEA